ncbi:diacylglycerol kinase [Bremerella sp. P1]|uniref:diacylglycerol kinase n=1 Tax=Bremerella sp. P1 TaxID=3026424 RepID=UPI002368E46B|nr:diacylglycerol kinase [Bremerella sp. P1]WDI44966.1 diacylglycerol kinase [Bremerella sp. P1]
MKNEMTPRGWIRKFGLAFSGLAWAIRSEGSFAVHLPAAALAFSGAALLQFDYGRWSVLILTIGSVIVAELFNTAIECLAKAVDDQPNEHIRIALDIGSAAVLTSSLFAVGVGFFLFWQPFWFWWSPPLAN